MITYLNVPNQCRALFDDWELFVLYATTEDFQKLIFIDREMMNEVRDKFWGPDAERDLLTLPRRAAIDRGDVVHIPGFTCKGYLLNENLDKGDPGYVKRPMAVMLRDGRVYVDEKMFRHARYVEMIPEIVRSSGDIFRNIVKL